MKKFIYLVGIVLMASCAQESNSEENRKDPAQETETSDSIPEEEMSMGPEERVETIKKWYTELISLQIKKSNCKTGKKISKEGFSNDTEQYEFVNSVKQCQLEKGYSFKEGEFNGYEWTKRITFYYKNDQLFFAFSRGGAEAYGYEYRTYYDSEGNIIKVLENTNDGDGDLPKNRREITDGEELTLHAIDVRKELAEINAILGVK